MPVACHPLAHRGGPRAHRSRPRCRPRRAHCRGSSRGPDQMVCRDSVIELSSAAGGAAVLREGSAAPRAHYPKDHRRIVLRTGGHGRAPRPFLGAGEADRSMDRAGVDQRCDHAGAVLGATARQAGAGLGQCPWRTPSRRCCAPISRRRFWLDSCSTPHPDADRLHQSLLTTPTSTRARHHCSEGDHHDGLTRLAGPPSPC
jgi:hypothetical protein